MNILYHRLYYAMRIMQTQSRHMPRLRRGRLRLKKRLRHGDQTRTMPTTLHECSYKTGSLNDKGSSVVAVSAKRTWPDSGEKSLTGMAVTRTPLVTTMPHRLAHPTMVAPTTMTTRNVGTVPHIVTSVCRR